MISRALGRPTHDWLCSIVSFLFRYVFFYWFGSVFGTTVMLSNDCKGDQIDGTFSVLIFKLPNNTGWKAAPKYDSLSTVFYRSLSWLSTCILLLSVVDFQHNSCAIGYMSAFSPCFPIPKKFFWQLPFHWDHFWRGVGKQQMDPPKGKIINFLWTWLSGTVLLL